MGIIKHKISLFVCFFALSFPVSSWGVDFSACVKLLLPAPKRFVVKKDAFEQWRLWEQLANYSGFVKPTDPLKIPTLYLPGGSAKIFQMSALPHSVLNEISNGKGVLAFKHPYNQDPAAAWFKVSPDGHAFVYATASRSLILTGPLQGYSLKLSTDHPHAPPVEAESDKVDTSSEIQFAMATMAHIQAQDAILPPDPMLILLPEVLAVISEGQENGYILRDIRTLQDGHYYLPAFSIPTVGREIARRNGEEFEAFWQKHYAEAFGEAKARLLLRYGLQLETPNSQNVLIQLDRRLKPTGRLVIRDLADSDLVAPIVQAYGFTAAMRLTVKDKIKPFNSNSFWLFDKAGSGSVGETTLKYWREAHNWAFSHHVIQSINSQRTDLIGRDLLWDTLESLSRYLNGVEGQRLLQHYRQYQKQTRI